MDSDANGNEYKSVDQERCVDQPRLNLLNSIQGAGLKSLNKVSLDKLNDESGSSGNGASSSPSLPGKSVCAILQISEDEVDLKITELDHQETFLEITNPNEEEKQKCEDVKKPLIQESIDAITQSCGICYESIDDSTTLKSWNCCEKGTIFCSTCMTQYLEIEITSSRLDNNGKIKCPCGASCGSVVDDSDVKWYNPLLYTKYKLFSNRRLVDSNSNFVFCSNPSCGDRAVGGTIIQTNPSVFSLRQRAHCGECGVNTCYKCGQSHSLLIGCELNYGSEFDSWKYSTVEGCKRCPSCSMYIEKNEGCNHMTCGKCRHQVS